MCKLHQSCKPSCHLLMSTDFGVTMRLMFEFGEKSSDTMSFILLPNHEEKKKVPAFRCKRFRFLRSASARGARRVIRRW